MSGNVFEEIAAISSEGMGQYVVMIATPGSLPDNTVFTADEFMVTNGSTPATPYLHPDYPSTSEITANLDRGTMTLRPGIYNVSTQIFATPASAGYVSLGYGRDDDPALIVDFWMDATLAPTMAGAGLGMPGTPVLRVLHDHTITVSAENEGATPTEIEVYPRAVTSNLGDTLDTFLVTFAVAKIL